jgi:1,2-diacylglycerol 3-alpha-glucosyltransferase
MTIKNIVFVLPSLLHYHIPRFHHFNDVCRREGIAFYHIELCSHLKAYPWRANSVENRFTNITLFFDQFLDEIPVNQLWDALLHQLIILKPDVVFLYGYSIGVFRKARSWAAKHGVATVILSDSNTFDKKRLLPFELLKSLIVSRFDAAFVGGTSSLEYIHKLGIPSERCVTGFDVIDTAFFMQRNHENLTYLSQLRHKWDLPDKYFLFIGRLIPEKNIPLLMNAYQKYLQYSDRNAFPWDLVICGDGPENININRLLQDLPDRIHRKVHLVGHIEQPDVIDFLTCSACLVLPSISESWGLVVNEAMACGIPVLVSNRAGCAKDLVRNGVNGWIFDPMHVDQLTSLMIALNNLDESTRLHMGRSGQEIISDWGLERFSMGALSSARIGFKHRRKVQHNSPNKKEKKP